MVLIVPTIGCYKIPSKVVIKIILRQNQREIGQSSGRGDPSFQSLSLLPTRRIHRYVAVLRSAGCGVV